MAAITKDCIPTVAAFMPELWELIKNNYVSNAVTPLELDKLNCDCHKLYNKMVRNSDSKQLNLVWHLLCGVQNWAIDERNRELRYEEAEAEATQADRAVG